jgi:benzoate 4-monooxygenase
LLITNKVCGKLPILQAVINETLRLYPTIIASLPRTAMRDVVVGGVDIPRGVGGGFVLSQLQM